MFGWALAAELLTIDEADRIVLTTRGRLLSNELFSPARLMRATGGISRPNPLTLGLARLLASLALNHREC